MNWMHGAEGLAGVGTLAISILLLWLFTDSGKNPASRLSATRLVALPMTVLLIFVTGVALLFMSAGLI